MLLGIDPGSKFTGMAELHADGTTHTYTLEYQSVGDHLMQLFARYGSRIVVACEEFKLYPWKAEEQAFSELRVVEVTGVVKDHARRHGVPVHMTRTGWKRPTTKRLAHHGIPLTGGNRHEMDAELAAWAAIFRELVPPRHEC